MVSMGDMMHGPNQKFLVIGGIGAAAIVLYEMRKTKLTAATAAPVDTTSTSASVGAVDPNYTDPSLSYAQDTAGLFGYSSGPQGSGSYITNGSQQISGPSTNAAWSQLVQSLLINGGYDPTAVQAALGHYVVGTSMTAAQWEIVQAGIALEGPPPAAVPAPNIAPVSAPGPTIPQDGYYTLIPNHWDYQVQSGQLYGLQASTAAALRKNGTKFTQVLANNPIFKLPRKDPRTI